MNEFIGDYWLLKRSSFSDRSKIEYILVQVLEVIDCEDFSSSFTRMYKDELKYFREGDTFIVKVVTNFSNSKDLLSEKRYMIIKRSALILMKKNIFVESYTVEDFDGFNTYFEKRVNFISNNTVS